MTELTKEEKMLLAEKVRLIGKRWNILQKLIETKYYGNALAEALGKSPPEICKFVKELEENGLVESERIPGKKLKYYYASDDAKKIVIAITQVAQTAPEKSLEERQIDQLLNIIEDEDLSDNIRLSFSSTFHHVCGEYPAKVASHERARKLFERVAADPFHDKASEDLMRSLSAILPHTLDSEKSKNWVLKSLYPAFIMDIENGNEKTRVWAIKRVGNIAMLGKKPSLKNEATRRFQEIWFSGDTDPESEIGKEVKQQLLDLASDGLIENVRVKAKDQNPDVRAKAEILLEKLKEYLLP